MSNGLVSVIMPTYNQAQFIGEAIRSVIEQTYSNWELIVINNFSEDDTVSVVEGFQDKRITLINFKNNGVIAASRNAGIRQCKGNYIAFLDSDDIWLTDKLSIQMSYLNKHKEVGLIGTNAIVIPGNKKLHNNIRSNRIVSTKELFLKSVIVNSTVLMRDSIVKKIGFLDENPAIRAAEDLDYWIRASFEMKLAVIKKSLIFYRIHPGNASELNKNTLNSRKIFFELYLRVLSKYDNNLIFKKAINKFKKTYSSILASVDLNENFTPDITFLLKAFSSTALLRTKFKILFRVTNSFIRLPWRYFRK